MKQLLLFDAPSRRAAGRSTEAKRFSRRRYQPPEDDAWQFSFRAPTPSEWAEFVSRHPEFEEPAMAAALGRGRQPIEESVMAQSTTLKVPKATLAEREELQAKRRTADREAEQCSDRLNILDQEILAAAEAAGIKPPVVLTRLGFVVELSEHQKRVGWKDEFLRVVGPDEAATIQESQPMVTRVKVSKAA